MLLAHAKYLLAFCEDPSDYSRVPMRQHASFFNLRADGTVDNSTVKKVIIIVNQFLTKIMSHISCTASLCCMQAVTCERSEHNGHHNVEDFSAPEIESLALCHLLLSVMLAIGQ